jgi:hypothetical protein
MEPAPQALTGVAQVPAPGRWRAAWPWLRAALVLFHVAGMVLVSCPAPTKGQGKDVWQKPTVRAEVESWAGRFARLGLHVTPDVLSDTLMDASQRWQRVRGLFVDPFVWWQKKSGTPQGWYMFTAPDRHPQVFTMEIPDDDRGRRKAGREVFRLGYSPTDPRLDGALLGEHRLRRAMFQAAWTPGARVFKNTCAALSDPLFQAGFGLEPVPWVRCRLIETNIQSRRKPTSVGRAGEHVIRTHVINRPAPSPTPTKASDGGAP